MTEHVTVLLAATVSALLNKPEGRYVDLTFGRGGHSRHALACLSGQGQLLALDRDPQAAQEARQIVDQRFSFVRSRFGQLQQVLADQQWADGVDGVMMDLGVSSPQLDQAQRGFSMLRDGPLDMRMDPQAGQSAAQWLAAAEETELADVFWRYGEERHSRRIARAIVRQRVNTPLQTTTELAELIAAVVPKREPGKHPATRVFQAIRIFINDELGELERVLPQALAALSPGGRLVAISFHSLEDRIVKRFMRQHSRVSVQRVGGQVLPTTDQPPALKLVGKAQRPNADEVDDNSRARSAVMRVAERTEASL